MTVEDLTGEDKSHEAYIRETLGETPRERLPFLARFASFDVPDAFDPDQISWVTDRLGVTDLAGALSAAERGYLVINTAGEINSLSDLKIVVDHREGQAGVRKTPCLVSDAVNEQLAMTDDKVVIHCYMGMERSVLSIEFSSSSRQLL